MLVTITFNPRDDLSYANRERVKGTCLTTEELRTARWPGLTLSYTTNRSATEVIEQWESEGFEVSEFDRFTFSRH